MWLAPLVFLLLAGTVAGDAEGPTLHVRFIGNAGIEVTDGKTTLLVDFPYRSGAFGYMKYSSREITARPDALCLFTHSHADHFDPSLAKTIGCTVIGPPSVVSRALGSRKIPATSRIDLPPIVIVPIPTPHGKEPHESYRVSWSGRQLYFTGDTQSTEALRRQQPVDVLFVTPWLLADARRAGILPRARKIVVYHHREGEAVPDCRGSCVVPRPGDAFELPSPAARSSSNAGERLP